MPQQLDQPGTAAAEGVKRPIEGIFSQVLLHQHRQTSHPFAHIRGAAGQVDANAGRQGNHWAVKASSTRRSARPSTWASTRRLTPLVSTISIIPDEGDSAPGAATGPVSCGSEASGGCRAGIVLTCAKPGAERDSTVIGPLSRRWRQV